MLKNKGAPGSLNGSGLFQTIVSLKIREVYEKLTNKKVDPSVKAPVSA
jgi:phosphoribulokinase